MHSEQAACKSCRNAVVRNLHLGQLADILVPFQHVLVSPRRRSQQKTARLVQRSTSGLRKCHHLFQISCLVCFGKHDCYAWSISNSLDVADGLLRPPMQRPYSYKWGLTCFAIILVCWVRARHNDFPNPQPEWTGMYLKHYTRQQHVCKMKTHDKTGTCGPTTATSFRGLL